MLNNPYTTDATVQTTARGSAYTHQDVVITNESITINGVGNIAQFIDRADLAQTDYAKQMDLAESQGTLLDEFVESKMLAAHADWTDFDNASIGGGAGNITVSIANIDDIVRGIKREIGEANGRKRMQRDGAFIIWREADLEILEAYAQANGFQLADKALKDGVAPGYFFLGMYHYVSNSHTSGHVFAGVRKAYHLGIVKDTWGLVTVVPNPAVIGGGAISGIGVDMRVDYAFKAWTKVAGILFDVLVA